VTPSLERARAVTDVGRRLQKEVEAFVKYGSHTRTGFAVGRESNRESCGEELSRRERSVIWEFRDQALLTLRVSIHSSPPFAILGLLTQNQVR
jgi:hypothetical protein